MKIHVEIVGGMMAQNVYLVEDENTKSAIIVDPGDESKRLIEKIEKENLSLKYIVLTHGHFDHIGACDDIQKKYDIPIVICEGEEILIENADNNLSKSVHKNIEIKADIVLKDNDIFSIDKNLKFKAIKTPGHTPGGMCLYFENEGILISGDTLFRGSIGRTDFPYGNSKELINSLDKLKNLPDNTKVYAGHGDSTTIGEEKMTNPYMGNMYNY